MKNILENNKLIAEFLGYSQPHPDYPKATYWHKKDCQPLTILLFHKDWNWLMEVIDKIETIVDKKNNDKFFFEIYQDSVIIFNSNRMDEIIEVIGQGSRINNVYQACVEFIQLYNKQN